MKKFASLALALTLTGAAAFADPALTVSAYVDSGVKAEITKDGTTFQNYASDWDDSGVWAKIGTTYAGDKAGFNVTVDVSSEGGVATDTAYGWLSPLEGLKLFAGTSYSGAFDGLDDTSNDYFSSKGISALYAVSGFTLGAGVIPAVVADDTVNAVFGAAYSLDKVAAFHVNALTAASSLDKLSISASLSAVENLSLSAGYVGEGIADEITQWIDLSVGYQITKEFSAGVTAYDYVTAEYFGFTPNATYKLTDAATLYGEVGVTTETTAVKANFAPKVKVSYAVDAASTVWAYAKYDANAETTTLVLDYTYSF